LFPYLVFFSPSSCSLFFRFASCFFSFFLSHCLVCSCIIVVLSDSYRTFTVLQLFSCLVSYCFLDSFLRYIRPLVSCHLDLSNHSPSDPQRHLVNRSPLYFLSRLSFPIPLSIYHLQSPSLSHLEPSHSRFSISLHISPIHSTLQCV